MMSAVAWTEQVVSAGLGGPIVPSPTTVDINRECYPAITTKGLRGELCYKLRILYSKLALIERARISQAEE